MAPLDGLARVFRALAVVGTVSIAQAEEPPLPLLAPFTAVSGEIHGGEGTTFAVHAEAGDVLSMVVEQQAVDLALTIADPAGRTLLQVDDTGGRAGTETAVWIAALAGPYRLEIRARPGTTAGRYVVRADAPRPAVAEDVERAAAAEALSQGARLRADANGDTRRRAVAEYEKALALFRALRDTRGEALALGGLGTSAIALPDFVAAVPPLQEALERWRSVGDRWHQGFVLGRIGEALIGQGKGEEAVPVLLEAVGTFRETGDRAGEAQSLNDLGAACEVAGDGAQATEAYGQALRLRSELGDIRGRAETLTNLGVRQWHAGELQLSLDSFLEALQASRAAGDRRGEAFAVTAVGQVYDDLGDFPRALHNLGLGLALSRELGDRRAEVTTLAAIGYSHRLNEAWAEAREAYHRSIDISRAMGDRQSEAYLLRSLAVVSSEAGRQADAREYLEQSLRILREMGDLRGQATALSVLCRVRSESGESAAAHAHGLEALDLSERLGVPRVRIGSLHCLAQVARARGELAAADERISAALDLLDSRRQSLRSDDLRASYVASVRSLYDLHVRVLMERDAAEPTAGFAARAFQAAERARARSLLDLLAESRANVREGVDPELLRRESSLREGLSAAGMRALRAAAKGAEAQQAVARQIDGLTTEIERTEAEIRAISPRYAALTQPQPTTVSEVQALLDDETLLLSYSLGEGGSYAWLIGRGSLESVALPPRSAIEAAARGALAAMESEEKDVTAAAAELSRLVLGPLGGRLTTRRLVLVADGGLQYVPFAALPDPRSGAPLVALHEIVGLPSAATLVLLRRDREKRTRPSKTVAVLADPVFEASDERLGEASRAASAKPGASGRAGTSRAGIDRAAEAVGFSGPIPRLPFTRREARAILAGVPARASLAALDFDASRATLTDPSLAQYRVVHLATHGFLNAARPELSGILLSLFGRDGRAQPGFLTAADAFNLKLSADLVVLSGCRTALGKEIRGEGIVGLTRGFMYAGADRVMASTWKVDDAATAALMTRFYRAMLGPRALSPAAALRAAQLDMRGQPRYRHPYYWAAFQLQGASD
jgi:CHAT domain-containing protein